MAKRRHYGPVFDKKLAGKGEAEYGYTKSGRLKKKRGRKKGKRKSGGVIPLNILKRRLVRLSSIVKSRS